MAYSFFIMLKRAAFLSVVIVVLLSSCVPEKRLAKQFVKNPPNNSFLIMTPDYVYKESIKPIQDSSIKKPTDRQKDSIAFFESEVIQFVTDSMFLDVYFSNFSEELELLGLNVHMNTPAKGFFNDTSLQSYIINVAQAQLQEYTDVVYDREAFGGSGYDERRSSNQQTAGSFDGESDDGTTSVSVHSDAESGGVLYYYKHELDGVHLSVWVELQKMDENDEPVVLFSELSTMDDLDGHFRQNQITGQVKYSYKIDALDLEDMKRHIASSGTTHASYLFDFLMNQYIAVMLRNKGIEPRYYMHYNREEDKFEVVYEQRFILQQ